jgi:hypothetical protein
LQRRLAVMDDIQRREHPSVRGRSQLAAFPQVAHSGWAYTAPWERAHWSLAEVAAHLAGYVVPRRVDRSGTVSVYNRNHYVGKVHQGATVYIMFDPVTHEWVFVDEKGRQLRSRPAPEISQQAIRSLKITHRRHGGK